MSTEYLERRIEQLLTERTVYLSLLKEVGAAVGEPMRAELRRAFNRKYLETGVKNPFD